VKPFRERLKSDEPIVYDGGFGSQLFDREIELTNSALANELYPADVISIHSDYISAGSAAIGTNTFVASPLHLQMAGRGKSDAQRLHGSPFGMRKPLSLKSKKMSTLPVPSGHRPVRLRRIAVIRRSALQMQMLEKRINWLSTRWQKKG